MLKYKCGLSTIPSTTTKNHQKLSKQADGNVVMGLGQGQK